VSQSPSSTPSAYWLADLDSLDPEAMRERVRAMAVELDHAHERERQLALLDALTGLGNRRDFLRQLDTLFSQHRRNDLPVSVVLLDVDRLAEINDAQGHPAGDRVLRAFANSLAETLRGMDMSFRIDGDELAIILPDTSLAGALAVAEKARAAAADCGAADSSLPGFTVSAGVAAFDVDDDDADAALRRADQALARALADGGDRVGHLES